MLDIDWVAFGGFAQLLAALATVALALTTVRLASQTRKEASSTERLAQEAVTDRQLQWRPQLELRQKTWPYAGFPYFSFGIANTGAGPALSVVCIAQKGADWARWNYGDLVAPNVTGQQHQNPRPDLFPPSLFANNELPDSRTPMVALFCRDILNRQFRFMYSWDESQPFDSQGELTRHPAEIASAPLPDWAREPLIWE
jgi:hypothetical protein